MKIFLEITGCIIFLLLFPGCDKKWDEHFGEVPEAINKNLWEEISGDENLSIYVQLMKDFRLDTLFRTNNTYTLFVPDNNAFESYPINNTEVNSLDILKYHISRYYIPNNFIQGKRKLQTFLEKYALYDRQGASSLFDGVEIMYESPLYLNGKYFVIDQVAEPKDNLFQYISKHNGVLMGYIEDQDSIILDKELSKPIGFDDYGNTIYDTVATIYNPFEELYFPVREESRVSTATLVYPAKEQYELGLSEMAQKLGSIFVDHSDIPVQWQEEVLVPYLLHKGFFLNMIEEEEFVDPAPLDGRYLRMLNILGDSAVIDYVPVNKTICSNGYAYDYAYFSIPDSLFLGTQTFEGEWLMEETGINKFDWNEDVIVSSTRSFSPLKEFLGNASNDTIVKVRFPDDYNGTFDLEFYTNAIFPAEKFLVIVGTHMDIGGIYNVYVNDELVKEEFDYYEYVTRRGIMPSVAGGFYKPDERFNKFDFWVENHHEYGGLKIRFEYLGPGKVEKLGLVIDHIDFVPY